MDYENSFYVNNVDEFDDKDLIPAIYPRNPYDDDDADNIFGLGNKQKKAERKLKKAEKKLAQGKTKKAEKKIAKANKLLGQIQTGVDKNLPSLQAAQQQIKNINAQITPTEALNTDAGQIGSEAGALTPYANTSGGGGGAGGDYSTDMGGGYETGLTAQSVGDAIESDEPTGDLAKEKELEGVTVTATKGNKTILFIVIGALLLIAVWYFSKHKSKK